jgi:hypothetical protein
MDRRLSEWKLDIERLWLAATPDYREAARIAGAIASLADESLLRQAATQALPILRSAAADDADQCTGNAARRRVGVIRDVLHELATPRFGKRQTEPKLPTAEEGYRQMLGLPLGRRLSGAEIHRAYKRAAKTAHPDGGGNARAFLELSAAHDALMKVR